MADLKGLIETVAKALADQPEVITVRESERRGTTVYELQVASGDLGRVIGRQGRTRPRCARYWRAPPRLTTSA